MLKRYLTDLFRGYAALVFVDRVWIGAAFACSTFIVPNVGTSGLLGAVAGLVTAAWLGFSKHHNRLYVLNSLLVGLSLGAFFEFSPYLAGLIVLSAFFTVFVTVGIADSLWRWDRLPALSLPFVLVAVLAATIAHSYTGLHRYDALHVEPAVWFGDGIDAFFNALGATYFTPHPVAGAIIFAGLFWRSRYLALLALSGYLTGLLVFSSLTNTPDPGLLTWSGFTFAFSAVALGGIYTIPSRAGFLFALTAAAVAALLAAAFMPMALNYHLPVMAAPLLITTLTMLVALRKRSGLTRPWLAPQPGLPEVNYERARLATVRAGELNSVPLLLPVYGEWHIYQGFDGPHTHQPPWQHALDLHMTERGRSFRSEGRRLEDYFCFDLPIISPAHAEVVRVQDSLPDNAPGEVDVKNNWGNFVLLRLHSGLHVLLAHLRQHSVKVKEGQRVIPGTPIAQCGNSGRSPQPHLHLQVQAEAALGSATHPFHLCSVLITHADNAPEYHVIRRPQEGERVQAAESDVVLAARLHLPVGRSFSYAVSLPDNKSSAGSLSVELKLTGQFRLSSARGASCAFEETNGVLAFYDRIGPRDPLLDLWLIALGLTPLTERAQSWHDAPSARLFPLTLAQRLTLALLRPMGCGVDSHYRRQWHAAQTHWIQTGHHSLRLGFWQWHWHSEAIIDIEQSYAVLRLRTGTRAWSATLTGVESRADEGIPAHRSMAPKGTHHDRPAV